MKNPDEQFEKHFDEFLDIVRKPFQEYAKAMRRLTPEDLMLVIQFLQECFRPEAITSYAKFPDVGLNDEERDQLFRAINKNEELKELILILTDHVRIMLASTGRIPDRPRP